MAKNNIALHGEESDIGELLFSIRIVRGSNLPPPVDPNFTPLASGVFKTFWWHDMVRYCKQFLCLHFLVNLISRFSEISVTNA